ncbi:hypothetical protein [Streptomyces hypolithicus]
MGTVRFSVSMPAEIRDQIKEHAARAGLDVSTFLSIAACAQMDQQDRVRRIFEPFEKARSEAEAEAASQPGTDTWTDHLAPTPEEQAEVDAILGRGTRHEAGA